MNRFLSQNNHSSSVIRLRWRQILTILVLLCAVTAGFWFIRSRRQPPVLWGSWQCSEQPELSLHIEPDKLTINGLCLSYELTEPLIDSPTREQPQGFVLDGGPLGVLPGLLFQEQDALVVEIDGDQRHFLPAEP